jgi:hypothetical protein
VSIDITTAPATESCSFPVVIVFDRKYLKNYATGFYRVKQFAYLYVYDFSNMIHYAGGWMQDDIPDL